MKVGSLGTSQWEASDIWHFFSCDVRKGHHSKARSIERRNLIHADSFLFISRVAASKNHTFFNHFLCLTITHYRESSHIFAQCPFLTSRSIFGHIWPCGGLMRTTGKNIDKTAFTFSARKIKGFNISEKDSIFLWGKSIKYVCKMRVMLNIRISIKNIRIVPRILWIETHQPWARFAMQVDICRLSMLILPSI